MVFTYPNDTQFIFPVPGGSGSPTGPAGGDLTGTYPNPTIANDAVTTVKIADDAVTSAKILLDNGAVGLRARNITDTADITLIRLNTFDIIEIPDNSGTQASIDITNRLLVSSTNNISVNYETGVMNDATGSTSVDAYTRVLKDSSSNVVFDYEGALLNSPGNDVAINLSARTLSASSTDVFLNFENFQIYDKTNNNPVLDFTALNPVLLAEPDTIVPRKLVFNNEDDSFGAAVSAPVGLAANTDFVLPPDNGTAGYLLTTDGSGNTSWVAPDGGITELTGDVTATGSGSVVATIANDAVTSAKVRLDNGATGLRARDAANTADITLIRLNSFDIIEIPDNSGTQASIDVTNRLLVSSANNIIIDYENAIIGNIGVFSTAYLDNFKDTSDVSAASFFNRLLRDTAGAESLAWDARQAKDVNGNVMVDYATGYLADQDPTNPAPALDFGTTDLIVKPTGTNTARALKFQEGLGTFSVAIKASDSLAANYTLTLPLNDGAAGEILSTDGSGVLSWISNAGVTFAKETITLTGTDITNQYVTLANTPGANTVMLLVKGGGVALEGASHDFSLTGAQLNFLNDLATGGGAALVAGDVLQVMYNY